MAEYDNVQGLTPASYVQLKGFTVGTVKTIQLSVEHPDKVLVIMSVDKKLMIPDDSKASIVSLDLLGTKAVNLVLGTSAKSIEENQLIQGDITAGTIESLGASATPAIDSAKITIASLNKTIQNINKILDVNTQNNLKSTLSDMSKTMKDFSEFANQLNAQSAKIASLIASLNSFAANLDKNGATITHVLNNVEATTANLKKVDFDATISLSVLASTDSVKLSDLVSSDGAGVLNKYSVSVGIIKLAISSGSLLSKCTLSGWI
jgi:phospholipid/cholesterol/gamma-HCH transport system substrate-binding protein